MPSVVRPSSRDFQHFLPVRQRFRRVCAVGATPLSPRLDFPLAHFEGGVPDLRTERAEKPISPASDPSTWRGRFWTGNTLARPGFGHFGLLSRRWKTDST